MASMRFQLVVGCVLALLVTSSEAATRGSNGEGLWILAAVTNSEGVLTDGIPEPVTDPLVNIPRFPNALNYSGGLLTTQATGNLTVQAQGSVSHWTPNNGSDSHFGFFPVDPIVAFTDFGELATQNDALLFGNRFDLDFFVDGNGIGATPIFMNLPLFGVVPAGYRYRITLEATWSDTTTDGDAAAADVTLSDTFTITNPVGSPNDFIPIPLTTALQDNGAFGPVTANFNDHFEVNGFYEVLIDKLPGAPGFGGFANIPPEGANLGLDFENAEGFFLVPEPTTATLLLISCVLLSRRNA